MIKNGMFENISAAF